MNHVLKSAGLVLLLASEVSLAQRPAPEPRPAMEATLQAGLSGRWWTNPRIISRIGLTPDQQNRMDAIFQQNRLKLIDLNAALDKEEALLEPLMEADQPDAASVRSQIDRIVQARSELEKANSNMLLGIRLVLTPSQWKELHVPRIGPRRRPQLHAKELDRRRPTRLSFPISHSDWSAVMKITRIWFGLLVVCLVNHAAATARPQTLAPERPAFEAASIKARPATPGPLRVSAGIDAGGIQYRNITVTDCIRNAWGVERYRISGGPDWLGSDRYDIVANASSPAPKAQLMLMLQTLLQDRFGLKIHLETRGLPIYGLVVGKNALKLKPGKIDGETEIGGGVHLINSRGMTMHSLAGFLTQITQRSGRPIFDMTGLDGVFDITLDFVSDTLEGNNNSDPDIFAALQAVGLKLESQRRPFEVLVIDHIERPSEN